MVSSLTIVFSVITLLLSLIFPIALAIYFCRKHKAPATSVLFGALTFFVFQLVLRIPLLQILSPIYPGKQPVAEFGWWKLFLYSLFLAVTAALFEEGGRVIVYKIFLKKKGDWKNAVAFGIGHGGFEAISIVGISYINNLILMLMINLGFLSASGNAEDPISQAVRLMIDTPSYLFLLAGIERFFTIILHVGFSLLVVYGMSSKKYIYILYAFLGHFILNFPLAFFQRIAGGVYISMAYIGLLAALSYYWITRVSPHMFSKFYSGEE
ncbi:MAG TPA: YhfC family intramembrane metalloprotease [Clostridiales bacterium]|nr:YhfC family intramembrane metalloprotease [Clostridiales bacterium]